MNIKPASIIFSISLLLTIETIGAEKVAVSNSYQNGIDYSPHAGNQLPNRVFWGDTHLHTKNSMDARGFGVTLGPAEAYRFARGEEVTSSHGVRVKLARPLDWLVVADHSDGMGAMDKIITGDPELLKDPKIRDWHQRMNAGKESALAANVDIFNHYATGRLPEVLMDKRFTQSIWDDYVETADKFNDPGNFTAIIGYEWTSTAAGNNLHRNILYRDGADIARKMLPFTATESFNPEDLWKWMEKFEAQTGGKILALAHNGNLSNGIMFPVEINPATGEPLSAAYAQARAKWEPLYEVTQIKGDGEAHPFLSPNDEFADYETWDKSNMGPVFKESNMLQYEYAREALKNGLKLQQTLGTNPYKFGMVGSTDSHTGLATAEEENFFGKHSGTEPQPNRWEHLIAQLGEVKMVAWEMAASGYAGVWAHENTREALFDALARKEVYATTGPRITLRFFGGWDYTKEHATSPQLAEIGYANGVPMGGDLPPRTTDEAPRFIVAAARDPFSANLDRIQIIKGWLDASGNTHEQVYEVAWSGNRVPDRNGKLPPVGSTVDVANATWNNSIGAAELATVWQDPHFDPNQNAFYYARVLEIPTPRWSAYDAKRFGDTMSAEVPMTTQERAYTSPIWYNAAQ